MHLAYTRPEKLSRRLNGRITALWVGLFIALICGATAATADTNTHGADGETAKIFDAGYHESSFTYHAQGEEHTEKRQRKLFLWYPTNEQAKRFDYRWQIGEVAKDAKPASGRHPLIVFSHGFLGSGDQAIYLTEELARRGYLVAATNHSDSLANRAAGRRRPAWPNFADAKTWDDRKFFDRKEDCSALLSHILTLNKKRDSLFFRRIDVKKVAAMGHSLGGYTALALAGARPSWKDDRIDAALLLAPYALPFYQQGDVSAVNIPVMLQAGARDWGITFFLPGVYKRLPAPKYFLVLDKESHFAWTNLMSLGKTTTECVRQGNAELIAAYGAAFLDRHLKNEDRAILTKSNPRLKSFHFQRR